MATAVLFFHVYLNLKSQKLTFLALPIGQLPNVGCIFGCTFLENCSQKKLVFWCATRQVDKLNNENFFFPGTVYVPGYLCNVF